VTATATAVRRGNDAVEERPLIAGAVLLASGLLGLVGNLMHPRMTGEDVAIYQRIAGSGWYLASDLLVLVAILLLIAGLADLSTRMSGSLAAYGRLAVIVGGTIAVSEITIDLSGLRQHARTFVAATPSDHVGAFWATNAIDGINSSLFGAWTAILLGLSPLLLAAACWTHRRHPRWLCAIGMGAGLVCLAVGTIRLLSSNPGDTDVAFLVASLLFTIWIIGAGWLELHSATMRFSRNPLR
jgi:hypothetical protein